MTKYRLRLANGRVIGPFVKKQLFELKSQGHILGNEEAQVYPAGDWLPLHRLDFFAELMDGNATAVLGQSNEDTFIIDLTKVREAKNQSELEAHDIAEHTPKPIELTETIRFDSPPGAQRETFELEVDFEEKNRDGLSTGLRDLAENRNDKTLINPVAQEELAKLRKQQKVEEERLAFETMQKAESEAQALAVQEEKAVAEIDQSTQFFALDEYKEKLLTEAKSEEKVIRKELRAYRKRLADEEGGEDDKDEDSENTGGGGKKKLIYLILGAALLYVFLFPAEDKNAKPPFIHYPTQITFPQPFDKADGLKSKAEFEKGMQFFLGGTYEDLLKAGIKFKRSYEQDLENLQALHFMARSYGEQLKYSKNLLADAQTFFNLLRGKRPFLIDDPNGVIGVNRFYMAIGKQDAAVDVIAKYLKLNPKNVTQDLFATYVDSLIDMGKIDLSRQFLEALVKAPEKTHYTLTSLIKYSQLNQEPAKVEEYIDEGARRFPRLVKFLLLRAEFLAREKRFDEITPYLERADALNLENNDHYRARFMELQGLLLASRGDVKNATRFFAASLKLVDSTELRLRLAELSAESGETETDRLIAESKSVRFLNLARDHFEKHNYELALSNAAKAVDAFPASIEAATFLAKVQLRLGLAAKGVETLETLEAKYMDNMAITLALVDAYIETYKFNQAKNKLAKIAQTDLKHSYEYSSAMGKLYLRMGDSLQAISWFKNSIALNPINDQDMFHMAELLIRRANFAAARTMLNKCIELDPNKPEYRIAYAKIIYETQDDVAAVGYLLGLLDEFVDNPQILSEIAIFYYRAGKVKDFEAFRNRIQKIPFKDRSLFEFMIKAAQLDERYDDIPKHVESLLEVEPGALDAMMTAGVTLFEQGKLIEAAKWFRRIQEKMQSFPKVQYYIARISMLSGDLDRALTEVETDMKENGETDSSLVLKAQILVEKGDLVEAENFFKRAQKLNSRSYEALVGLADISTKRNNFDLALDLYKRAMSVQGEEPVLHKKVGDVYRLLGQGSLAMESYKMYLEMKPEAADKQQIEAYIKLMQ